MSTETISNKRVRGVLSRKGLNTNAIYPKFVIINEVTDEYSVIENPTQLDALADGTPIYEVREAGLGVTFDMFYVRTNSGTKNFLFRIIGSTFCWLWGDTTEVFQLGSGYTFEVCV